MKTVFSLSKTPNKDKENITISNVADIVHFSFSDSEKLALAKKSQDFMSEIYNFYSRNELQRHTRIRQRSFDFGKFFSSDVLNYMNKIPYSEKGEIVTLLNNLSKKYKSVDLSNKFALFTTKVKKLSKSYQTEQTYTSLIPSVKSLKSNTLLREEYLYTTPKNQACKETYLGFVRAIRSNTLTTAKVIINGEEKRLFFKSGAGVLEQPFISKQDITHLKLKSRSLNVGYNPLGFDPETLKIYEVTTKGKQHFAKEVIPANALSAKERVVVQNLLKKEFVSHLNNIYAKRDASGKIIVPGIRRMKETYERMKTPKPKTATQKPKPIKNKKSKPKITVKPR